MAFVDPNGHTQYVPGVYSRIRVVSDLPGAAPEFNVPVILGGAFTGFPYNADASKAAQESRYTPFALCNTAAAVDATFGRDSDLAKAMRMSKRHGLPFAFVANLAALTRASCTVTSTGPVLQYTLLPRKWGALANHIKIKIASGNSITVTGPRNFTPVATTMATTDTRIYVRDNSWIVVGQTVTIGDNVASNVTKVVAAVGYEWTTAGQKRPYIDLTAAVGTAFATTSYAVVLDYDTQNTETSGTCADAQAQIDWFNNSCSWFIAVKNAAFTNPASVIALAAETAFKDISVWDSVTLGTSPAAASAGYTAFVSLMDASAWDLFLQDNGVMPRAFLCVDSSSTIHATLRDWAVDKRAEGYPISVTVGTAWGDTSLSASNDTNPKYRAAALDSQDVMLCAGGLDYEAAYVSLAPAVFGRRIEGGLAHNVTNDALVYSQVEVAWDERVSGKLTALHRAGVCTYRLNTAGPIRYVISQGLSTLQNNANAWNVDGASTALIMQRDLADYVDRVIKVDLLGQQIGADGVTPDTIAGLVYRRADRFLLKRSLITAFTINSVELNDAGTGYDLDWSVKLPATNDFIGMTTNILIGG